MAAKIIYSKEVTPDIFMDIVPPKYQYFKINLAQCDSIGREKKSGLEVSRVHDFTIKINASEINNDHIPELSAVLKDLFQLPFSPYQYATKTYNFFTTYKQEQAVKYSQLTQILEYLQEFEIEYNNKIAYSIELFNKDSMSKQSYSDAEIVVKYDEIRQTFVVLALSYLGAEKYSLLSKASIEKGTLEEQYPDEFFSGLIDEKRIQNKKKKIFYFIIEPQSYLSVKHFIEKQTEENIQFYETQKNVIEKLTIEDFPLYTKPNIFGFKINYNDSLKCFSFYAKSFNKNVNPNNGEQATRSLLGRWAVNFIFSEEITDQEAIALYPTKHYDEDIELGNHYKIILDFKPGSSNKEKNLIVAATDIDKLRKLKENFLKYEELFNREEVVIKIIDNDFMRATLNLYPSVYLDEIGNAYFIYGYRSISGTTTTNQDYVDNYYPKIKSQEATESDFNNVLNNIYKTIPKIKKERLPSTNMRGVAITYPEMVNFITDHPWAEHIKNNTVYLNTEIWLKSKNANMGIKDEEREEMFESLYFRAKLNYTSEKKITNPTKKKKI